MSRTIEKIILGVLVIAILSISSMFITGLEFNSQLEIQDRQDNHAKEYISLEKAKAIALSVADGAITEALLERENGALVYEIEITKNNLETDVLIDPLTGNVLKIETNEEEKATKEEIQKIQGKITEEQAKEIALREVRNMNAGEITDIELEKEQGYAVYAVEFTKNGIETDIKIDVETGRVIKIESDLDE